MTNCKLKPYYYSKIYIIKSYKFDDSIPQNSYYYHKNNLIRIKYDYNNELCLYLKQYFKNNNIIVKDYIKQNTAVKVSKINYIRVYGIYKNNSKILEKDLLTKSEKELPIEVQNKIIELKKKKNKILIEYGKYHLLKIQINKEIKRFHFPLKHPFDYNFS